MPCKNYERTPHSRLVHARGPIITPTGWHAAHALNDCGVARTVRTTHEKYLLYGSMVMSGA
jgi:hypothetical protein